MEDGLVIFNSCCHGGVEFIVMGHCTADEAFAIMHEVLGDKVRQMHAGFEIECVDYNHSRNIIY